MIRQSNKMAAIVDLAELTIGKLLETLNVPQCLPLHLIYFLQCSDLVLEARFYHHTSIQHYRLKISSFFAYFLCLKERNGTTLKMQDFIISDIAKLNR